MRRYWLSPLLLLIIQALIAEKSVNSLQIHSITLTSPPDFNVYLPIIGTGTQALWISPTEVAALPMNGVAWDNLLAAAQEDTTHPQIKDQEDDTDVYVLAKALVYARTGETHYRDEVVVAIMTAIGTEGDASTGILPIARNVQAYVIAADLIHLSANQAEDAIFRQWLTALRTVVFTGGGGNHSIITCHEKRPNNFGTHCGATRIAIALYLNDRADLDRAAAVFHGWLGDRTAYTGFNFGDDLSWQCDPAQPVGINPVGCMINGHSVDGVLPDDQRRAGEFAWPPPKENYVWEALQGAVVQANLLERASYPAWEWEDQALLRAVSWLYEEADYAPEGDDRWEPWLINEAYQANFPAVPGVTPGKGMGWTDWTFAP